MIEKKKTVLERNIAASKQFAKNVEVLQKEINYTNEKVAEYVGVAAPTYSKNVNGKKLPSSHILLGVSELFGYKIDDLLYTDIRKKKDQKVSIEAVDDKRYEKFCGLFQGFYFANDAYKVRESLDEVVLKSCVLLIYKEKESDGTKYKVLALFDMDKEKAEEVYGNFLNYVNEYSWKDVADDMVCKSKELQLYLYHGEIILSAGHASINMKYGNKDSVSMIFYDFYDNFIGGLGTMTSVSCGRDQRPVMQYIALTRNSPLDVNEAEIAKYLRLNNIEIEIDDFVVELTELINKVYGNESMNELDEKYKKILIQGRVNNGLKEIISRNLFRKAQLYAEDDEKFHNFLLSVL